VRLQRQPRHRCERDPLGVVLAGGLGRRMGGSKAVVELNRRPLITYPIDAVWRALGNVAIVAKINTELPNVPGVSVWVEPEQPRHPLAGIVHALGVAENRPVLICAADMPFVSPAVVERIAHAEPGSGCAVVASARGELQPLLACYQPEALSALGAFLSRPLGPLRDAVESLRPARYEVEDPDVLFNINSPSDLLQAAAMIDRRRRRRG
jgi:molybdopterin-guanine dinucleotide biosynthesis protein A